MKDPLQTLTSSCRDFLRDLMGTGLSFLCSSLGPISPLIDIRWLHHHFDFVDRRNRSFLLFSLTRSPRSCTCSGFVVSHSYCQKCLVSRVVKRHSRQIWSNAEFLGFHVYSLVARSLQGVVGYSSTSNFIVDAANAV